MSLWRKRFNASVAIFLLAYTAGVASVGLVIGVWLQHKQLPSKLIERWGIDPRAFRLYLEAGSSRVQDVPWQDVNTHLHAIQVATVKVSDVTVRGGSLAEVGGNLVIASPHGQIHYMDASGQLRNLDLRVPMNMEALRSDPLYKEAMFNIAKVRTHGLLAIRTGAQTYDLYATFNRFAGRCFEFVVSKVSLEVNDNTVRPISGWRDVWTAKPCIRLKDRGELIAYEQSGGRMVRLRNDTILVSVGDHQFDGFYDSQAVSMDPASDLGKLVEVNIETGVSRHFAIGLRNPQGLTIAPDGRIWQTEHGPQGGDEVNLMIEGQNYGWPIATYGMTYGYPPRNWPFNPKVGGHDGYTRPRLAFVPAIGTSAIIAPDAREFPNWAGSLLLCSMRASTLYVLKTEGDDIVYAEPIPMQGYKLRDIVSLPDGRLAILADGGWLLLVRNAEIHRGEAQRFEVSGLSSLPPPLPDEGLQLRSTGSAAERGKRYFDSTCATCHSLTGEARVGPPLNGVVGRRFAAVAGFGYSDALKARHGTWTEAQISSFISNPAGMVPGTSMPTTGVSLSQSRDVAAYLRTTRGR